MPGPGANDILAALGSPDFYPGRPRQVEARETHISWVFLAGERAYKLKKPLVLPFLDYGTPARRRAMCEEEIRLNRRLARDIYLRVRSIASGPSGMRLAAPEDPKAVDFLVEMRRYEERATLAARLEHAGAGELGDGIDSLAALLARFHARVPRVAAECGGEPAVRLRLEANIEELLGVVNSRADTERVLALARFTDAFLTAHADELGARALSGLVVEGHGDLRAEHVLLDGSVRVVDCVEFNPRMRELDVADELAFLVMDLTLRGAEELAHRFVDSYRRAGGDPGEHRLVAFYACFRALVRAKVALMRARQAPARSALRRDGLGAAGARLALAERFAWRARLPLVIAICGLPAVGKSTLAGALADASGLRCLSSDAVRKRAAGIAPHERAPLSAYGVSANRRTYAALGAAAARHARADHGAIVDATFRHRADRAAFLHAFGGEAPLLFVECVAPFEVMAERARRREAEPARISDASEAVVRAERQSWEPLGELAAAARTSLRSDRPLEEQLAALQRAVDSGLAHRR